MKPIICYMLSIVLALFLVTPSYVMADNEEEAAAYLLRMINLTRAYPMETIGALGIDESEAREALGDNAWVLDMGCPPVAPVADITRAAADHLEDMVHNLYYSSTGLDGSTVLDRLIQAGFTNAAHADELLGLVSFAGYMSPMDAARLVFEDWVRSELDPAHPGPSRIFNPRFRLMGLSFKAAVLDLGQATPPNVYVVGSDLVKPKRPQAYLFGNVYRDTNGDGSMEMDEGLMGLTVRVKGYLRGEEETVTGAAGLYSLPLPQGFFTVVVVDAEGNILVTRAGFGDGENYWLDLRVRE